MITPLTYDEWRNKYTCQVSDDVVRDLQEFHQIDAMAEIESAMKREYEWYCHSITKLLDFSTLTVLL
jgi:hypothetical protein